MCTTGRDVCHAEHESHFTILSCKEASAKSSMSATLQGTGRASRCRTRRASDAARYSRDMNKMSSPPGTSRNT
jgi:hypothetical protein